MITSKTKTATFDLKNVHTTWRPLICEALKACDPAYIQTMLSDHQWLPGPDKIFNAFSLPLHNVNYVLFGESPYPRASSANGYAFWDAAVDELWSDTGLSTRVNRATSLRNFMKMLLIINGKLSPNDTSQPAIATINKSDLVQTNSAFFQHFLAHGFLLLNATPIFRLGLVKVDAKAWKPFLKSIITQLAKVRPTVELILLGNVAKEIDKLIQELPLKKLVAEHPYNISFIQNLAVQEFFKPFELLKA
jgi:uracil-DNA glycosylase